MLAVCMWLSLAVNGLFPLHFLQLCLYINISNLAVPILEIRMTTLNRLLHTFNIFEHKSKFCQVLKHQ